MPMSVRDDGTWKPVERFSVRSGGVWRNVLRAWVRTSGTWRVFFVGLSASASPTSIFGSVVGSGIATSGTTTAVPESPVGTPSYSWEIVDQSGAPVVVSFTAGTSPETAVQATLTSSGQTVTGNIRCNVTDSAGSTVQTNNVSFTLSAL